MLSLDEGEFKGADFGVGVVGDSMVTVDNSPGDFALIHQQPTVRNGETAAIVITTPEESLEVIKKYHHRKEQAQLQHWFLESDNPLSQHLVVIPSGVNVDQIQARYIKEIRADKVRLLRDAELVIAGKYVGSLRRD